MQRVRLSSQPSPIHKFGDFHMTFSPKFKFPPIQSPELDFSLQIEPLIPGLPDDVALNCLLRLPVSSLAAATSVCHRWRSIFITRERFFSSRKTFGIEDPWLFVFAFHKITGQIQWQALDLKEFTWHEIPAMPCKHKICPHGLRCVSIPRAGALFVCGGMVSDVDCPLDSVLKFDMSKNQWSVMDRMVTARSFFASGVIDGLIYVAGGNSNDLFELDSAEVLDPGTGKWTRVTGMGTNMASYDAAVLGGKLLVTEGWLWPFFVSPRGRVYDPRSDKWENMRVGLREGWTGSSVVVFGRLFVVSELERMKLKVYDVDADTWEAISGPPLPEQICKPFAVNGSGREIYVVGRNLFVAVGLISKVKEVNGGEIKWVFGVTWRVIEPPERFSDFTPSSSQVLFG